jgi:N-methylhydantoinase B
MAVETQTTEAPQELLERHLKDLTDADFEARYSCDRFTASVLASRYRYVVKHMCTHLLTNAFSVILRDWYDFGATLSGPPDLDYPMSAVSDSLMIFTGTMSEAVRNTIGEYGPENLHPGDIVICNDPYRTGTHPNDTLFSRPIFHEDRIVGFVNIQPHMMDMGGIVPAGFSPAKKNVYENGLVIPPTLLMRDDKPVRSTFALIFDNARFGEVMLPDMLSICADLRLGERLILETIERYGLDAYLGAMRYATDVSAEAMREALAATPDGVYEGEDTIDCDAIDDTREYTIRAKVKIAGSRVEVDLSGTSGQARTCINAGWLDAKTSVATALKFLIERHSPFSSGAYRHIDIVIPPKSIVSAEPPDGAIMLYWEASSALLIAILKALAQAVGEDAIGGDFASAMVHNGNGLRQDGSIWASSATCGGELGPWGASKHADAENSLGIYLANSIAPAVEAIEADAPVVMLAKEYVTDSAGAGRNRGGASTRKDTLWLTKGDHYSNVIHVKRPSGFGVNGARDGAAGAIWLWQGGEGRELGFLGDSPEDFAQAEVVAGVCDPETHVLDLEHGRYFHFGRHDIWKVEPGAVFRYQNNAGGGWGNPLEREPERVLRDVRDEYVSAEAAREVYGVVVEGDPLNDPEGLTIDEAATEEQRRKLAGS